MEASRIGGWGRRRAEEQPCGVEWFRFCCISPSRCCSWCPSDSGKPSRCRSRRWQRQFHNPGLPGSMIFFNVFYLFDFWFLAYVWIFLVTFRLQTIQFLKNFSQCIEVLRLHLLCAMLSQRTYAWKDSQKRFKHCKDVYLCVFVWIFLIFFDLVCIRFW